MSYPTNPCEGWRWVKKTEILKEKDQVFIEAQDYWLDTSLYPNNETPSADGIYRRRIEGEQP